MVNFGKWLHMLTLRYQPRWNVKSINFFIIMSNISCESFNWRYNYLISQNLSVERSLLKCNLEKLDPCISNKALTFESNEQRACNKDGPCSSLYIFLEITYFSLKSLFPTFPWKRLYKVDYLFATILSHKLYLIFSIVLKVHGYRLR